MSGNLQGAASGIIDEAGGINRVVYDISGKLPAP
ncbi:MAG: hypothetical protein GC139_07640 [Sideroxydans sp.]|nr:hypothetical protein [Sideroxydans sp.]